MRTFCLSWLLLCCCAVLVGCGSAPSAATPPTQLQIENLLSRELSGAFTDDKEVIVSYLAVPPNTPLERHWHPGEEFIYILEGSGEVRIDGQPTLAATPGTVVHIPYESLHSGVSGDAGLRLVVFRVHAHGQPARHLEQGGTSDR